MKIIFNVFVSFIFSFHVFAQCPTLPTTIKIGTNCSTCSVQCPGTVDVRSLESYVQSGLDNEWISSWNIESLKAGSVAYRTYGVWRINNPRNSTYDIRSDACDQAWGSATSTNCIDAANATIGEVIVNGSNTLVKSEYSAENNNAGCGDGYCGDGSSWPCISDNVCSGTTTSGHGRGMCQWGSSRWANQGQTYTWILDHYYNPGSYFRCLASCTAPPVPTSCTTSIGTPANGLEHHTNLSCSAVTGADGYRFEYSFDGTSWNLLSEQSSYSTNVNNNDNPNLSIYYRVSAYKCTPKLYSGYTYASPQPVYTACDDPAIPTVNNPTSNSLNVTLNTESPVANPSITTYAISTNSLYVQSDGSLDAFAFYQSKSSWGTITVTGLSSSTQYCFDVFAKNYDGTHFANNPSNAGCGTTSLSCTSTSPTSLTANPNTTVLPGTQVTLSVNGGSLGAGANWHLYKNGCGSEIGGTELDWGLNTYYISPNQTTTYFVRAEANGCTPTSCKSVTVDVITCNLSASISNQTNVSCYGGNNGSATATPSNGTPPYSYDWSNGNFTQNNPSLSSGTYTVTVTDNSNCTFSTSVYISEPSSLNISLQTLTNVSCKGQSNGAINISVSGGTPGYSYFWNNSSTTEDMSNLSAGIYTITVTDSKSCTKSASFTVTEPSSALSVSLNPVHISCLGGNNGTITTFSSGGTSPYNYSWSNEMTNSTISGLMKGSYTVTITDNNGCTVSSSVTLTEPLTGISLQTSAINPICFGNSNGSASVTATGGTSPYSYAWSSGQTASTASNLNSGVYTVTVSDNSGCTNSTSVTLSEPSQITATVTPTNISCNGSSDGSLVASIFGGTTPYTYLWSVGETTSGISGLSQGNYYVTVTDANSCTTIQSATIDEPPAISLTFNITKSNCTTPDGIAEVIPAGGSSPYQYSWSNGVVTSSNINLPLGSYPVTVTDSKGCTSTGSAFVSSKDGPILDINITDAHCGFSDGTATVSVTSGVSPFTYSWNTNPVQTLALATGLKSGSYTVTVTDANSCASTKDIFINDLQGPSVNDTILTHPKCYNSSDGTIDIIVSGGSAPYQYSWSNGAVTSSITNLPAGNYAVTVTDKYDCNVTSDLTMMAPPEISISLDSLKNVKCNGGNEGSIFISVSGGASGYSFLWSNVETTEDNTGLTANDYSVTVSDINGCANDSTFSITEPLPLSVVDTFINYVSCNGGSDGMAHFTLSGGTPPYTYAWNTTPIQLTDTAMGLTAGLYTCVVTDSNNCSITPSLTMVDPSSLIINFITSDPDCYGSSTGNIKVIPSGGQFPYTYSWNTNNLQDSIFNLAEGKYFVTVTDNNGCSITDSVQLNYPGKIMLSFANTQPYCFGFSDGSIQVSASLGNEPYNYAWSNGGTMDVINNLVKGIYSCTVTDSNGCQTVSKDTLNQPEKIKLQSTPKNISCKGFNDGKIDLTPSGGTGTYSFEWFKEDLITPLGVQTEDIQNLSTGTYLVSVTDNNNCMKTATVGIIDEPSNVLSFDSVLIQDVTCRGDSTGNISVFVSGGWGSYMYSWANGSTNSFSDNLTNGVYTITVMDIENCVLTRTDTVNYSNEIPIITIKREKDAKCIGTKGVISISSVTGGLPPYSFLWFPNGQTEDTISNLDPGYYYAIAVDSNGCKNISNIVQLGESVLTIDTIVNHVTCFGKNNGSIILNVNGGSDDYSYSWNTGLDTIGEEITNLSPGIYSVTVTERWSSCTTEKSIQINEPEKINFNPFIIHPVCYNSADGFIKLNVTGGIGSYIYSWSSGMNTDSISSLTGGDYSVTVTDANFCTLDTTIMVIPPVKEIITFNTTHVKCNGGTDGSVFINVTGSTSPYSLIWSFNSDTSQTISNISSGKYYVTITNTNNCSMIDSIEIYQPEPLNLLINAVNLNCYGDSSGSINLLVTGGTSPYSFSWSNGEFSQNIINLSAGIHSVTVTDAFGCSDTTSVIITENPSIIVTTTNTNVNCNGDSTGAIDLTVSGGMPGYSFIWNTNNITEDIENLLAGIYSVTVTDTTGCSAVTTVNIAESPDIILTTSKVNVNCNGDNTGAIDLIVNGGVPGYTFLWNTNGISDNLENLPAGIYSVTVTDSLGCSKSTTESISENDALNIYTNIVDVKCYGDSSGSVEINVTGGTKPYTYLWSTTTLQTDSIVTELTSGDYSVTVTDINLCKDSIKITITQPDSLLNILIDKVTPENQGQKNGSISVLVSGGTPPFIYKWSNDTLPNSNIADNITSGYYSLTVYDSNNCTALVDTFVDFITGVGSFNNSNNFENHIKIYPNPNSGQFIISTDRPFSGELKITVMDMLGRVVFKTMPEKVKGKIDKSISVEHLYSGPYMVLIWLDGKVCRRGVVVE